MDLTENKPLKMSFWQAPEALRLDVFIAESLPRCSRRIARKACKQKQVRIKDRPQRAGYILSPRDLVSVEGDLKTPELRPDLVAEQGGAEKLIEIVFEDDYLLAVSKPRAMHSLRHRDSDPITLADCIAEYAAGCVNASTIPCEAGLIQRLDFETSGVVIAAKTREAFDKLRAIQQKGEFQKTYSALVEGVPPKAAFIISEPLVQSSNGKRMEILSTSSKEGRVGKDEVFPALTRIKVLQAGVDTQEHGNLSLVQLSGANFRRHQLRAHLSHAGHPLVGDVKYGSSYNSYPDLNDLNSKPQEGFFLNAERVSFIHPITQARSVIDSKT